MIIYSDRITRFLAGSAEVVSIYPFIILPKGYIIDEVLLNHERIHLRQQLELLVIPFYLLYVVEFLLRRMQYPTHDQAYRNISFEREAYTNAKNLRYLNERRFWSWMKYVFIS